MFERFTKEARSAVAAARAETFGEGALDRAGGGGAPRFGRRAKKALELALREAIARGDRELGPEQILLGLTHDGGAMELCARHGVTREELRAAIVASAHGA